LFSLEDICAYVDSNHLIVLLQCKLWLS
jgi:hypothetical protein